MKRNQTLCWWTPLKLALVLASLWVTTSAEAAIPRHYRPQLNQLPSLRRTMDFSRGFDIGLVRPVESLRSARSEDVGQVIPSSMRPTNDERLVATQILDHSIANFLNSEAMRSTSVGKAAQQIEKTMTTDIAFGGQTPESIKHSLQISMQATDSRATVKYSGLTNANLVYYLMQAKTAVEIHDELPALKGRVVYSEVQSQLDRSRMLSLRWNW